MLKANMKAFRHLGECGSPGRAQSSKTDLEGRERDLLMKVFWFLVVGVWAAGTVWAFPPGHQPFLEDSRPDAYELQTIYAGEMLRIGDEPVFYVHNILTFDQGRVRVANKLHPGFPLIQWDQNEIHSDPQAFDWKEPVGSETTLLMEEQKRHAIALGEIGLPQMTER